MRQRAIFFESGVAGKTAIVLLGAMLWAGAATAQVELSTSGRVQLIPPFNAEALNFLDETGKSRIDLYLTVAYTKLGFTKQSAGFKASYEVTVDFLDERDKVVQEKIWSESITVETYNETSAPGATHTTNRSLTLPPAAYKVLLQVRDIETDRTYSQSGKITAKAFSDRTSLSSVMLLAASAVDSSGVRTITPRVSEVVPQSKDGVAFFYEVYADSLARSSPTAVRATYTLRSMGKRAQDVATQTNTFTLAVDRTQVFETFRTESVTGGDYTLLVRLETTDGKEVASAERLVRLRAAGLSVYIRDLEKAIDQLQYIADWSDIEKMKTAKTEPEKLSLFTAFWKQRDPTPKTADNELMAEYYSRVEYANQNFSNYTDGWRTDMGMIFVKYGQPDFVDRQPFNFDSKPYEVWEFYQKNRRFIFIDESGFGDYRLARPEWDLRNRIR